ncbi:N-acetylmuramic acid 6-phosphate etherase [uncultured Formosa sp.]|uniref:N-acetylmuramic acid 6-phosphate etherase n=1 Tax=uncultured Formosa sp. TaxID=255435 RepID=UPI002604BA91|nr:N-acetylmuramic acid 6-phosphate etherase [uncultured Formosa sp.]
MTFIKTTEANSKYNNLEKMTLSDLLININNEDKTVPFAIEEALPQIELVIKQAILKLKMGGRIFYIGAGTSGRLGVLDASECPPTFGVNSNVIIGIIAGGDKAIRNAVEFAEDSTTQAWEDLQRHNISNKDIVIGIAASGTTPYVISALEACNDSNITTTCITCNKNSPLSLTARYPIEIIVGPEFLTGSSRMKAGTAQKLVLNMISTASMIQLGKVKGNKMVDMQLNNDKLVDRGIKMIMAELNISYTDAERLLQEHKNVRASIDFFNNGNR